MISVTKDEVIRATREIVAERPEFVYTDPTGLTGADGRAICLYVHGQGADAVPGCLVGAVLAKLGVPLERLAQQNSASASSVVPAVLDAGSLTDNELVADFLTMAQDRQDTGDTWANALNAAEQHLAELEA